MANELEQVNKAIKKKFGAKKLVFGQGFESAKVVFVTDPPTPEEEKENKPISGNSEKSLNKLLKLAGLDKRKVYILMWSNIPPQAEFTHLKKLNLPFLS